MKTLQSLVRYLGKTAAIGTALWLGAVAFAAAAEAGDKPSTELALRGLLVPFDKAMLSTRSTGVIKTLKEEGSPVRKGEVVIEMDNDVEKASVVYQEAFLEQRKWQREANLKLRAKNGSSEEEERTAKANLDAAKAQLDQAKAILDKKLVYSPIDGVVVRRVRQVGEGVDQFFNVIEVVDVSKLYLETFLPSGQLKNVHPGDPVEVRVSDMPDRTFAGQVSFIQPTVDPASGESRIKILIDNPDNALRAGMSAVGALSIPNPETRGTASAKP